MPTLSLTKLSQIELIIPAADSIEGEQTTHPFLVCDKCGKYVEVFSAPLMRRIDTMNVVCDCGCSQLSWSKTV